MAIIESNISNAIAALTQQLNGGPSADPVIERAFADGLAVIIADAIKTASLNVPGTGLIAPTGGGPVTGASTTGSLS